MADGGWVASTPSNRHKGSGHFSSFGEEWAGHVAVSLIARHDMDSGLDYSRFRRKTKENAEHRLGRIVHIIEQASGDILALLRKHRAVLIHPFADLLMGVGGLIFYGLLVSLGYSFPFLYRRLGGWFPLRVSFFSFTFPVGFSVSAVDPFLSILGFRLRKVS